MVLDIKPVAVASSFPRDWSLLNCASYGRDGLAWTVLCYLDNQNMRFVDQHHTLSYVRLLSDRINAILYGSN